MAPSECVENCIHLPSSRNTGLSGERDGEGGERDRREIESGEDEKMHMLLCACTHTHTQNGGIL